VAYEHFLLLYELCTNFACEADVHIIVKLARISTAVKLAFVIYW